MKNTALLLSGIMAIFLNNAQAKCPEPSDVVNLQALVNHGAYGTFKLEGPYFHDHGKKKIATDRQIKKLTNMLNNHWATIELLDSTETQCHYVIVKNPDKQAIGDFSLTK